VRLHDKGGTLIGVGEIQDDGKVGPRRMFKVSAGTRKPEAAHLVPSVIES